MTSNRACASLGDASVSVSLKDSDRVNESWSALERSTVTAHFHVRAFEITSMFAF